jgi:hypothetical protein
MGNRTSVIFIVARHRAVFKKKDKTENFSGLGRAA